MSHHHHAIDYVEFSAPDQARARDFFARAFGWEFNDYGPEYSGIRGPDPHGPEAGGLAADGPVQPLVLVYSEDLDQTLEAVVAAGGNVTVEPFDFPGGRRFHFTDASGNELGVWGPARTPSSSSQTDETDHS